MSREIVSDNPPRYKAIEISFAVPVQTNREDGEALSSILSEIAGKNLARIGTHVWSAAQGCPKIEVTFSHPIGITGAVQSKLVAYAEHICNKYKETHPGRVMWAAGIGCKVTSIPVTDDEPIGFDEEVFAIDCAEREDYDWVCTRCGMTQGDHKHCITDPPAGACEFAATQ